jgi:hypothetical protein
MDEGGLSDDPGVATPFAEESVRHGLALTLAEHWNKKHTCDDEKGRFRTRDGFIAFLTAIERKDDERSREIANALIDY